MDVCLLSQVLWIQIMHNCQFSNVHPSGYLRGGYKYWLQVDRKVLHHPHAHHMDPF